MQTSEDDKRWQIEHMFRIYKDSTVCLVFPGGIQRLVRLNEPTSWIHRGWTLQEALAPPSVEVVYAWRHGSGMYHGRYRGNIMELIPGESAITPLRELLGLNAFGITNFFSSAGGVHTTFQTSIFGAPTDSSTDLRAERRTEDVLFMLKSSLPSAGSEKSFNVFAPSIWRSALFRASSRPVDMVFSIMGLFGVTLDTRAFDKEDRLGATIALMQTILRQGGRASWLGMAPYLPPHPQLSTYPIFPRTHVSGQVELEPIEGYDKWSSQPAEQHSAVLDVRGVELPKGSMDDAGYLAISRKAILVHPLPNFAEQRENHYEHLPARAVSPPQCCLEIYAVNGTSWKFYSTHQDHPVSIGCQRIFAVLLGWYNGFSLDGVWTGRRYMGALLIREHQPNRFHVESCFELNNRLETWVMTWDVHTLWIGGPGSISKTCGEKPRAMLRTANTHT